MGTGCKGTVNFFMVSFKTSCLWTCFLLISNDQVLLFGVCGLKGWGITNRIRMFSIQIPLGTQLLFGCPTANLEPLSKGQPQQVAVNHCAFYYFVPKVTRKLVTTQRCYEVSFNIIYIYIYIWFIYIYICIYMCVFVCVCFLYAFVVFCPIYQN